MSGRIVDQIDPLKPAVVMWDQPDLTYGDLEQQSNRLAHLFRELGLARGDHIAFVLENRPEFFVVAWAAQRAGLHYTPCSTHLTLDELLYIVSDSGAEVVIGSRLTADRCQGLAERLPLTATYLLDGSRGGLPSLEDALAHLPATALDDQSEGADMLYSSGTTGRPKGVLNRLPSRPFPAMSKVGRLCQDLFGVDHEAVYLSPAPLYHAASLRYTISMHRLGATVVVMDRFDAESFLEHVQRYSVTISQCVPTMFIRMLKLDPETRAAYDVSSLQAVVHSAAPCPPDVKWQMLEWLGPIIHEYYAGTEGNAFVYCDSEEWIAHPGTVGRSLLGAVHIVDDDGEEVVPGTTGNIYFEGPEFSYHNDGEKTRASRHRRHEQWSTLGDIGYVDDDGFLYLTDRRANVIISGGVNIYPQESENILALHPKVADVAVFGVPDGEMGERVHAVVEPIAMDVAGPELESELLAYCRSRLAGLKCPRTIEFRADLPRSATGKLQKRLLRDSYWEHEGVMSE